MVLDTAPSVGGVDVMWTIKGNSNNILNPIIGRFSTKKSSIFSVLGESKIRLVCDKTTSFNTLVGISTEVYHNPKHAVVTGVDCNKVKELNNNDILLITPDGAIQKIWDSQSKDNALFLTAQCNSRCIMCPQPLKTEGDYVDEVIKILSMLKESEVDKLCITGGEPTLVGDRFFDVLSACNRKLPLKPVIILTNGRNFKDFVFTKNTIKSIPAYTTFAIPLYAPIEKIHDGIVGCVGAFAETIQGIHNLARFNAHIEIRIVITKQNYKLLPEIANYIGWNFPMVSHVAFMGMEVHGMAEKHFESVWVEPVNYASFLQEAVKNIAYRDIPVSIYNLPYCLLPNDIWIYSRQSISDWKQKYIDACEICTKKQECAGFFTTSSNLPNGVKAV